MENLIQWWRLDGAMESSCEAEKKVQVFRTSL